MNSLYKNQYNIQQSVTWDPPTVCSTQLQMQQSQSSVVAATAAAAASTQDLPIIDINQFDLNLPNIEELEASHAISSNLELADQRIYYDMTPFHVTFENHFATNQGTLNPEITTPQQQIHTSFQAQQQSISMEAIASSDRIYMDDTRLAQSSNDCFTSQQHASASNNVKMTDCNLDILNSILISNVSNMSDASNSNQAMYQINDSFLDQCASEQVAASGTSTVSSASSSLKMNRKMPNKKKCSVCGNESSGYHYGSHTCEACKLFFRRTEKRIRKTGFTECQKKNCQITSQSRANCSQCRYKKCIAAGMSMGRSRYGRHTEPEVSQYQPNITDSLHHQIEQLKVRVKDKLLSFELLNDLILDFYIQSVHLLKLSEQDERSDSSCDPLQSLQSFPQKIVLPHCIILLFCLLFDVNVDFLCNEASKEILNDYRKFFMFIKQNVLQNNEFVVMLKIGLYLKVLRVLFETELLKEDLIDKRLNDLMRSEFAMFKYNSTKESPCLAMLFSQMNHILFKHMTDEELDNFLRLF